MENELNINENLALSDDELIHWGIRGMRWGIRRYQNKDGSLTPRGEKRYKDELKKVREEEKTLKNRQAVKAKMDRLEARKKAAAEKKKELDDEDEAAKSKGKGKKDSDDGKSDKKGKAGKRSVKDMSDAELAEALARARMEDAYLQLRPEQAAKGGAMKEFMNSAVKPAAISAGKSAIESGLKKIAEKALGDKVDPDSLEAIKKTFEKMDYKQKIDKIANPDKYKTAGERKIEFELEKSKADRAATMEGYADAADKAAKQREAAEAARRREADAAARAANEAKSSEYYNSSYHHKGVGEKTDVNPTSSGSSYVQKLLGSGDSSTTTTSLVTTNNVSRGQSFVNKTKNTDIGYVEPDGTFIPNPYYDFGPEGDD